MRKLYFALLTLLLTATSAHAQVDPQFSMYMFNRTVTAPASVGARGALNITAVGRSQWVGIDGHPNTFTLSADAPIDALHGGLGGFFMYDQIGPISTVAGKLAYAFRFDFGGERGEGPALQLGVMPGFFFKQIDGTNFRPLEFQDPVIQDLIGQTGTSTQFDLGAGVYFDLPDDKMFLGLTVDHLLEPQLNNLSGLNGNSEQTLENSTIPRSLSFLGGYRIGRDDAPVTVTPSTQIRLGDLTNFNTMQIDANVNINVDPLVFGVSYRVMDISEVIGIVGFNANQRLFIAYSYDYPFAALRGSTSGSHEIILSYTFPSFARFYPYDSDGLDQPIIR